MHNNLRHVYIKVLYKVHLASFTKMGTFDLEIVSNIYFWSRKTD